MVWKKQSSHSPAEYKILDLSAPGSGGLNIQDLDYTLPLNQSPDMCNMMVKNGAFGKRYGQVEFLSLDADVLAIGRYKESLFVQSGNQLWKINPKTKEKTSVFNNAGLSAKGIFINYNEKLYFMNKNLYISSTGDSFSDVTPYAPTIKINCTPDNKSGDVTENFNRLGSAFTQRYHGDGKTTDYVLTIPKENDEDIQQLDSTTPIVWVNTTQMKAGTDFDFSTDGHVRFKNAPSEGINNVRITAYKTFPKYREKILECTKYAVFGGQNNSRLFLGANGTSTYFFSDVSDGSYFPDNNYASVGNAEDGITGFGLQYNVLVVFKPTEIYQLTYSFESNANGVKQAYFYSSPINADMGCDMPDTIRYIDNRLTWGSTDQGICTLCSTLVQDERNVRVISRNINGGYRTSGLLAEPDLKSAQAINYEGRYMICCKSGNVYAWDYTNAPYSYSDRVTPDDAATALAWYKWDNIFADCYVTLDRVLYFAHGKRITNFDEKKYSDFGESIKAWYQTPLLDFGKYEYLKTVKKVYFEVRGDTPAKLQITYYTDETPEGESDPEDIVIGSRLWKGFAWETFMYSVIAYAKTFARKCSLKKIMLVGIRLVNIEKDRDLSLSGIKFEYTYVKEIK